MNWLAIVNPVAGSPRSARQQRALAELIERTIGAEVAFTRHRGHASELASAAKAEGLAVFGGDGTIAEVVNAMTLDRQRLLALPGGTGNGLARDLGLTNLRGALARAKAGKTRSLDLIRLTFSAGSRPRSQLAVSTSAIGYAAEVVDAAKCHYKRWGPWCYSVASLVQARRQKPFRASVTIDGSGPSERQLTNVMINNTQYAGNFHAFRAADPSDGHLEALLALARSGQQVLHNLSVLSNSHLYVTAVEVPIQSAYIELEAPQKLMVDGEIWEHATEACFEVLPGRLRCVV